MKTELNNIGTWGRLHYDFLYCNQRAVINAMRLKGTLHDYLMGIDIGVIVFFMGIAVSMLSGFDPSSASVVSGTAAAAAIINEIIAVVAAKLAFKPAGEIKE